MDLEPSHYSVLWRSVTAVGIIAAASLVGVWLFSTSGLSASAVQVVAPGSSTTTLAPPTTSTTTTTTTIDQSSHERRVALAEVAAAERAMVAEMDVPDQYLTQWGGLIAQIQSQVNVIQGAASRMEGDAAYVVASSAADRASGTPPSAQTCDGVTRVKNDNREIANGASAASSIEASSATVTTSLTAHLQQLQAAVARLSLAVQRVTWKHVALAVSAGQGNQRLREAQQRTAAYGAEVANQNAAIASVQLQAQAHMRQIAGAC